MRVVEGGHTGGRAGSRRVDLATAAAMLGISSDAVRKRAKRGTLAHERGPDGKLYVWVDTGESDGYPVGESEPGRGRETDGDANRLADELLEELRDRVRSLEHQLDAERQAHAETRRIAAMLAQRTALKPTPDRRDAADTAPEDIGGGEGQDARAEPQTTTEEPEETARRPWWLRWFGG
ncbi:MAG: hypothetical protein M3Q60_20950, partial [Actinomycetota bacterium]|nr:hypothetical protein [Actinomycetota bacterium]